MVGAIGYGKAVDGFVEHSDVAQSIAAGWGNGSSSFAEDLKGVLDAIDTDDVKNLTVSAALLNPMPGGGDRDLLGGLPYTANEHGVAERPAAELTAS